MHLAFGPVTVIGDHRHRMADSDPIDAVPPTRTATQNLPFF